MPKSRHERHREKKQERARRRARDSDTGYFASNHAPHLESAAREGIQIRNGESNDVGPGNVFSDPGQLRRDIGLASRVVAARTYLGSADEAIPKKLIKDAYKLADDSPELGDKIKMLELGVKLDRQELATKNILATIHSPATFQTATRRAAQRMIWT